MVNHELEVIAFPLNTTTIVVGDQVQVKTRVGLAQVELDILYALDGLCTRSRHTRP